MGWRTYPAQEHTNQSISVSNLPAIAVHVTQHPWQHGEEQALAMVDAAVQITHHHIRHPHSPRFGFQRC